MKSKELEVLPDKELRDLFAQVQAQVIKLRKRAKQAAKEEREARLEAERLAKKAQREFYKSRRSEVLQKRNEGIAYKELAKMYGISQGRVRQLYESETWRRRAMDTVI